MLKNYCLEVFIITVFLVSSIANSALIIVGDNPNPTQKREIVSLIREYTGPGASYFLDNPSEVKNKRFELLFGAEELGEEKFINHLLKEKYPDLTIKALTIPTTVWDVFVSMKWLTHEVNNTLYNKIFNQLEMQDERNEVFFRLSKDLGEIIGDKTRDENFFIKLVVKFLEIIKDRRIEANKEWSDSLISEYQLIFNDKPSILLAMLRLEWQTMLHNKVLFVRASNGIFDKYTYEEKIEILRSGKTSIDYISVPEVGAGRLIDSPIGRPEEGRGPRQFIDELFNHESSDGICKLTGLLQSDAWTQNTKNLSFANSILSGFLFDSFNRGKSACSFVFAKKYPHWLVYVLPLKKEYLFSNTGQTLFHVARGVSLTDGIFESQEVFHPRLRGMQFMAQPKEPINIWYSTTFSWTTKLAANPEQKVHKDICPFKLDENRQQYLRFISEALGILTRALIVRVDQEIPYLPNSTDIAKTIMSNQLQLKEDFDKYY